MTISIALCTYNGEKYLKYQLESILKQSIIPDEIIICDDGSTDNTISIIKLFQEKYPNIISLYQNDTNLGYNKNFEKAIHSCTKDIIIISDQDDVWESNKISEIIQYFKCNPQKDGVFHDLNMFDEFGNNQSYLLWKNFSIQEIMNYVAERKIFIKLVSKGCFILGCSLAIRKTAIEKYNLKNFIDAHDYYIGQILGLHGTIGFIPKMLTNYRIHNNQVCGIKFKKNVENNNYPQTKIKPNEKKFKETVFPYLLAIKRYKELFPDKNKIDNHLYTEFLKNRNLYLKSFSFWKRKWYILKCIRHRYLDLRFLDLLKY